MSAAGVSPTLAVNEAVRRRRAAGEDVLHLGFGEAGVPVHSLLREALARGAGDGAYGRVAGEPELRAAVAAWYTRRGVPTDAGQVVVAPGSKALLFALMLAVDGDVVLPQPSWVSYEPQARLTRKRVVRVPIPAGCGGVPDPERLDAILAAARCDGVEPALLVLTNPDNPTGTLPGASLLRETLERSRAAGLLVVSDEIYGDLTHDPEAFVSAAALDDGCVLTGGLSKSLAVGGWRIGVLRVPATAAGRALHGRVCAIASEIWSALPGPMARAARVGYDEPPPIVAQIAASRLLHGQVARAVHAAVVAAGAACRVPGAGFYLYPDLASARTALARRGIRTGDELATALLERFGIAVLPGSAFGDDPGALRFRLATSLLYGVRDDERERALAEAERGRAADLPSVRAAAGRLGAAIEALTG